MMSQSGIGKLLLQGNYISSEAELEQLSKDAVEKSESLITHLVKLKRVDYTVIANFISQKFQIPYMDLDFIELDFLPQDIDLKLLEKNFSIIFINKILKKLIYKLIKEK